MIDTRATYHAAYTIVALVYFVYALSLWQRVRKLRNERRERASATRR